MTCLRMYNPKPVWNTNTETNAFPYRRTFIRSVLLFYQCNKKRRGGRKDYVEDSLKTHNSTNISASPVRHGSELLYGRWIRLVMICKSSRAHQQNQHKLTSSTARGHRLLGVVGERSGVFSDLKLWRVWKTEEIYFTNNSSMQFSSVIAQLWNINMFVQCSPWLIYY